MVSQMKSFLSYSGILNLECQNVITLCIQEHRSPCPWYQQILKSKLPNVLVPRALNLLVGTL
jgi:hypothetical protein